MRTDKWGQQDMANIFRISQKLFCAAMLCVVFLSAAESSIPLRKSIQNRPMTEFITPKPSDSGRKKHENPNAQSAISRYRGGITPEQAQSVYATEVHSLYGRLQEVAEQMFETDQYMFEQMVKEDVFREDDFIGKIKLFSRVYAKNQTIAAGILMKGYVEAGKKYIDEDDEDNDDDDFSPFFVVTSNHKAKLTDNIHVGAKADKVSSFLKKAAENESDFKFKEEVGRIYVVVHENKYGTEFIDIRHDGNTITQIGYCEIPKPEITEVMDMPNLEDTWIFIQNKAEEMGFLNIMDELEP